MCSVRILAESIACEMGSCLEGAQLLVVYDFGAGQLGAGQHGIRQQF